MHQDIDSQNNPLSPEEIERLFIQGDRSFHQGNFIAAINIFEQLFQELDASHSIYFNLQRQLVKAYQQNQQIEQAIALCQQMATSDVAATCLWGQKFLASLAPEIYQQILVTQSDQATPESTVDRSLTGIKLKTLSEFKQYCQDNLLGYLKQLENTRKRTLITIIISGIICLVFTWFICRILLNHLAIGNVILLYLSCLSFPLSIWLIFCRSCIQVYGLGFKRNIIAKIIDFIDDRGRLSYASHLFLEDKRQTIIAFTKSQILRDELEEPESLEQEDCIYGTIGNTDVFFAEILVKKVIGGQRNELGLESFIHKSDIFHGLFFEAKFSKKFVSRTFIVPNDTKSKIAHLNNWRGELIKLEDPEFNRLFRVYGDSQIESRYILSTNLMSRLVDFNCKAGRKVYLSFIDGFVYIAIPYRHNLFEPKLFKNMLSFAPLREYFQDLQLMIGIVEDLNLNRRIWG
ncbi:DUF3137 domain-containing protein [Pleurocapsa sp. PCC 7319]|uniref:DUF3137 domain-containing protein n=1 Tax=Pleurocapsa sp. PCC 7319 TaxID=118161 RepID=UPI00034B61C6|nr:DUF3137 domain-containing protein [Pleurocapsa sp. PCC 7319]